MNQIRKLPKPHVKSASQKWSSTEIDPFQVFEVEHDSCLDFEVTVHRGEAITKGSAWKDLIDTPDPYLVLRIPGSANSRKRTSHVDNSVNPMWDTTFHFYLHPYKEHTLHVYLKDANYVVDEELGEDCMCVNTLPNDVPTEYVFTFTGGSKVYTTLTLRKNPDPDLRFSLALCQEEKDFLHDRRSKVWSAMKTLLGSRAPQNERQTPLVAVMGSGGGYRAMIALSGAVKALQESGILDCATYIAGLSGSSWYISTLYAHDLFPNVTHEQIQEELRKSVTMDWKWHLMSTPKYSCDMFLKYWSGQPVSFTDFFGHILCQVLLQGKKEKKLSDIRRVLHQREVPFPLFTCLHAKRSVSCKAFSEWIEFSPYEIGIGKYGTFMKPEHFGSKFLIGKVIKEYPEFPLHYLQGVWGSAFTILIKRLVLERGKKKMDQIFREAREENIRNMDEEWSDSGEDTDDSDDLDDDVNSTMNEEAIKKSVENYRSRKKTPDVEETSHSSSSCASTRLKSAEAKEEVKGGGPCDDVELAQKQLHDVSLTKSESDPKEPVRPPRKRRSKLSRGMEVDEDDGAATVPTGGGNGSKEERGNQETAPEAEESQTGIIKSFWNSIMKTNFLNSRTGRAGMIHNPFRGLSLRHSFPVSPVVAYTKEGEEEEADKVDGIGDACRYEPLDNTAKKLYVVDSGLIFNSPYPILLRPQRGVDLYISFEFSKRDKDDDPPFKEILLAEKWAQQNSVPFPPIKDLVVQYLGKPAQECYVFEHPSDTTCPVIIHFCLVNNKFRKYKAPGVLRKTKEEKDFADFSLFNDPTTPYETRNFLYEARDFDRLAKLSEFNTLLHVDTIKEELAKCCKKIQKPLRAQQNWSSAKKTFRNLMSTSFMRRTLDDSEQESPPDPETPPSGSVGRNVGEIRLRISEENRRKLLEYIDTLQKANQ